MQLIRVLSTFCSLLLFGNLSTPDGLVLFDARQSLVPSWQSWTSSHESFTWNKLLNADKTKLQIFCLKLLSQFTCFGISGLSKNEYSLIHHAEGIASGRIWATDRYQRVLILWQSTNAKEWVLSDTDLWPKFFHLQFLQHDVYLHQHKLPLGSIV